MPGLAASPHVDYCAVSTGTPFTTGTFHPTWLWSSNLPAAVEKSTKVLTRLWQTWRNAIQTQTRVVADAPSQRVTGTAPHEPLPAKGLGQRFLAHRAALLLRVCPVKVWAICLWTKRSVAERRDGFRSSSWYASHQSNVRVSMEKRGHTPITLVHAALAYFLDTPGNLAAR